MGGVTALAIGKSIGIRSAMGVRGPYQDVLTLNARHLGANPVAQHRGEAKKINSHQGNRGIALLQDHGTDSDLTALFLNRLRRPHAARDR